MSATIAKRRGSTENPLSRLEIEQKFRRLAAALLAADAIDEIIGIVATLERKPDLTRLTSLVAPRVAPHSHAAMRGEISSKRP